MNKKENITSSFIGIKATALLFFITAPYIYFIQDKNPMKEAVIGTLILWSFSALLWLYTFTKNKVYYDQEQFYIYNWQGEEIDIVPNAKLLPCFMQSLVNWDVPIGCFTMERTVSKNNFGFSQTQELVQIQSRKGWRRQIRIYSPMSVGPDFFLCKMKMILNKREKAHSIARKG